MITTLSIPGHEKDFTIEYNSVTDEYKLTLTHPDTGELVTIQLEVVEKPIPCSICNDPDDSQCGHFDPAVWVSDKEMESRQFIQPFTDHDLLPDDHNSKHRRMMIREMEEDLSPHYFDNSKPWQEDGV